MATDILQNHGDGLYSSKIGQASSLEDEFASKASLLTGGGCDNFMPNADDMNYMIEEDSDDESSSEEDNEFQGTFLESFTRYFVKEGKEVDLPANMWYIRLKDGPPEGCDQITNFLNFLKQVVGSDAREVLGDALNDTELTAILTDEEHEKLSGMDQVVCTSIVKCTYSLD